MGQRDWIVVVGIVRLLRFFSFFEREVIGNDLSFAFKLNCDQLKHLSKEIYKLETVSKRRITQREVKKMLLKKYTKLKEWYWW